MKIGIIGGGISGLSTAYFLEKNLKDVEIHLFEGSNRLGGKILTVYESGFVIEGGPDSIYTMKKGGLELIKELGLEDEIIRPPDESKAFIYSQGRLRGFPEGFYGLAPRNFIKLLRSELFSLRGKLRMLAEPFIKEDGEGDETLGDFVRRRLGKEALDRFAGPLLSGIYASDPEEMSILATFPYYREMVKKYGSLTRAALKSKSTNRRFSPFVSLKGGLLRIVEALSGSIERTHIHMNFPVESIERDGNKFVLNGNLRFDVVVLTVPAFVSAKILEKTSPELSATLKRIEFVSTLTISFAFRGAELPHNATGFMVARDENLRISACTFSSNKWPTHAPAGYELIRCFMGRRGDESILEFTDEKIAEIALNELERTINLKETPLFLRVFRWPRAMPQYRVGHLELLEAIKEHTPEGLYLTGASYRGIGIPDCIRQGSETALKISQRITPNFTSFSS